MRLLRGIVCVLVLLQAAAVAQQPAAADSMVVMVSLNGLGADYAKTAPNLMPNLAKIAAHGASAPDGMIPAYPSQSAPNQYTLVTGLYPEHHGLLADRIPDAAAETIPAYKGVPLWVLAEQHGLRTACLFWTGCEAVVDGIRPCILPKTQTAVPDTTRVTEAIRCLQLPAAERPRLLLLALSEVDAAARTSGPDSREAAAAVSRADFLIGRLRAAIAAAHLPVDLLVVSDRGLARRQGEVDLSRYADFSGIHTSGPLMYPKNEDEAQRIYSRLKIADSRFEVYRRKDLPKELHASASDRLGDPVVVATEPVAILIRGNDQNAGIDGLDPARFPAMRGVFYAEGPDIAAGTRLKPFANIHVYPLLAGLLGLPTGSIDGSAGVLSGVARSR